jgi:hypothetical protein
MHVHATPDLMLFPSRDLQPWDAQGVTIATMSRFGKIQWSSE